MFIVLWTLVKSRNEVERVFNDTFMFIASYFY